MWPDELRVALTGKLPLATNIFAFDATHEEPFLMTFRRAVDMLFPNATIDCTDLLPQLVAGTQRGRAGLVAIQNAIFIAVQRHATT